MTKLLQQALDALIESRDDVDLCYAGVKAARLSFRQERQLGFYEEQLIKHDAAIEALKQALAQQEQCGCREGECETKKDKTCRMTIEIAERDGIPEWTPAIGIECAISNLRDDAARLRGGGYTPDQIANDLGVIADDLAKCKPDAQQEPDDYASAKRLAETIYRKHYRTDAPHWEPLPDLAGVLSQIDNMVSGLAKAQQEQPSNAKLHKAFELGWGASARWAQRDDLIADTDSQAYADDRDRLLRPMLEQQEQPASVDAYVGAREDAAIWKKRALEAEELNRKFIAELNGPTYLGEPAQQEQPAQGKCKCGHVGTSITVVESFPVHSVSVDEEDPDYKEHYHGLDVDATLQIGLEICRNCKTINGFWIEDTGGAEFYADWGKPRYTHPAPTQPAQEPRSVRITWTKLGTEFTDFFDLDSPTCPIDRDGNWKRDHWNARHLRQDNTGAKMLKLESVIALYTEPPTQPALSETDMLKLYTKASGKHIKVKEDGLRRDIFRVMKAVEAHCRGGATS